MTLAKQPVTVIIPGYNEAESIGRVLEHLRDVLNASETPHEIIVVDDGSTDNTAEEAEKRGVTVVRHPKNRGYGASLKTGIRAAKHEFIVITDADGTYPVERIPEMLDKLQTADMVVGARVGQKVAIPLIRRPAKWLLRILAEYVAEDHVPDLNSGLRAFRRSLVNQYLPLLPDKFSFTTTITVATLCDRYNVVFMPIDYHKRSGKSKIVPWDFVNFVTLVLRLCMLFNPLKVFIPVSLFCFIIGGIKFGLDCFVALHNSGGSIMAILSQPFVSISAMMLLLSGLQILLIGMMSDGLARRLERNVPPVRGVSVNDTLTTAK